ncbi:hypothetical protein D9M68_591660 [compost metagenome]
MVVRRVVDVLHRHHPDAEEYPQGRGHQVHHGDEGEDQQGRGAWQEVGQLARLAAHRARDHGHQLGPAEGREVVLAAYHHFHLLGEEAVERRGDDIGQHGEAEEHQHHHQQHEQWPEDVLEEAQPIGEAGHEGVDPAAEFLHRETDKGAEQQQVDGQRQQDEQAQSGAQDQFQSFAEVLRPGKSGCRHGGPSKLQTRRP